LAINSAILVEGAWVQFLVAPVIMLNVPVVVKTTFDLKLHLFERHMFGEQILLSMRGQLDLY